LKKVLIIGFLKLIIKRRLSTIKKTLATVLAALLVAGTIGLTKINRQIATLQIQEQQLLEEQSLQKFTPTYRLQKYKPKITFKEKRALILKTIKEKGQMTRFIQSIEQALEDLEPEFDRDLRQQAYWQQQFLELEKKKVYIRALMDELRNFQNARDEKRRKAKEDQIEYELREELHGVNTLMEQSNQEGISMSDRYSGIRPAITRALSLSNPELQQFQTHLREFTTLADNLTQTLEESFPRRLEVLKTEFDQLAEEFEQQRRE